MKPRELLLRCYANKDGDQWQAFCIDFCLAAQGNSAQEAQEKLFNMIAEYLYDAMAGEDKEYADQLLTRKASLMQIMTYYFYKIMFKFHLFKNGVHVLFKAPVPMVPQRYAD